MKVRDRVGWAKPSVTRRPTHSAKLEVDEVKVLQWNGLKHPWETDRHVSQSACLSLPQL